MFNRFFKGRTKQNTEEENSLLGKKIIDEENKRKIFIAQYEAHRKQIRVDLEKNLSLYPVQQLMHDALAEVRKIRKDGGYRTTSYGREYKLNVTSGVYLYEKHENHESYYYQTGTIAINYVYGYILLIRKIRRDLTLYKTEGVFWTEPERYSYCGIGIVASFNSPTDHDIKICDATISGSGLTKDDKWEYNVTPQSLIEQSTPKETIDAMINVLYKFISQRDAILDVV